MARYYYVAAANYSCGAYGAGNFGADCAAPGGTGSVAGNPSGSAGAAGSGGIAGILADTGYNVLLPVAMGMAILTAAAILLVKRLRRRLAANRARATE